MTSNVDYQQVKPEPTRQALGMAVLVRWGAVALALAVLLFLSVYNLADYPLTWFDEGSHLHVPKTLVQFGVYADYSSEGFRYVRARRSASGPPCCYPSPVSSHCSGSGCYRLGS